jgi:signal transduction histidine kinase
MSHPTLEQLRPIDLFDGLDDVELGRWAEAAEVRELEPGAELAEYGESVAAFHLILAGSLEGYALNSSARGEPVGVHSGPTWIGAVSVLTHGSSKIRMIAVTAVTVAVVESEPFIELVRSQRPVFDRIMRQVRPVVARTTAMEANRERLASLGTMAAGLTHELNNPAAAAQRASSDLAEALDVLSSTLGHFVESGIEREQAQELVDIQRDTLARCAAGTPLDALDAADAEDELLEALEERGIPEPWKLSEPLAAAGVDSELLVRVAALAGPATAAALQWIAASLTAHKLAAELAESTQRMSSLVAAVKSYAYMDRGEMVEADIHEGLETTLKVLGHKLKHGEIEVVREYDRSLPKLTVHGGELNQVWTNLLDNAIQALGDGGTITITTALDGACVRVDIADDGPGIEPQVRERIFDPFFTTKDVGQGTGLGLDTARRIIVQSHRGSIEVDSDPGHTVFHVWLPLQGALPSAS